MNTYETLRGIADSWVLLLMFLFFALIIFWVFRPGATEIYRDTKQIPFRHEDKPILDKENQS